MDTKQQSDNIQHLTSTASTAAARTHRAVVVRVGGRHGLAEGQRGLVLAVQLQRHALHELLLARRDAPRARAPPARARAALLRRQLREVHAQQALPRLGLPGTRSPHKAAYECGETTIVQ